MKTFIQTLIIGALATTAFTAPAAIAAGADKAEEQAKKSKKPKKITDRRHPDYVRCRSEPIIGSLAKKRRVCMTNTEWKAYVKAGSRDSRQFIEDMQVGENTSN